MMRSRPEHHQYGRARPPQHCRMRFDRRKVIGFRWWKCKAGDEVTIPVQRYSVYGELKKPSLLGITSPFGDGFLVEDVRVPKRKAVRALMLQGRNKQQRAREHPGAFYYVTRHGHRVGMIHSCPCGCGTLGYLNFGENRNPRWTLTGPEDAPTLDPSVAMTANADDTSIRYDGYHWHGFLRDGLWKSR